MSCKDPVYTLYWKNQHCIFGAINCFPWIHIEVKNGIILPELGWNIFQFQHSDAVLTLKWSWSQKMTGTVKLHKLYHPANVPVMSKVTCAITFFSTPNYQKLITAHTHGFYSKQKKITRQFNLPFRKYVKHQIFNWDHFKMFKKYHGHDASQGEGLLCYICF